MNTILKISGALTLTLLGAVGGAMLTTNYSTMRDNGASYVPAVTGGLSSLWHCLIGMLASLPFLILFGALTLIFVTVWLTRRAMHPKPKPFVGLGNRMNTFVHMAHHDQSFRDLTTIYKDTMRVCHEIEAFIVEVRLSGIPVPSPQSRDPAEWIDLCCSYFTAVGPYLRNDNFTYAFQAAQAFANQYPKRG